MGSWGTGPFDNDTAADFIATKLLRPVQKALRSKNVDYSEARACAQFLLLSHGTDVLGGPNLLDVVKLFVMMRSDKEWVSNWNSPRRVAAALDMDLARVFAHMARCKGCRRGGKTSPLNEARALVNAMNPWKVPRSRQSLASKRRKTSAHGAMGPRRKKRRLAQPRCRA